MPDKAFESRIIQLVRCDCGQWVGLDPQEKSVCACCGKVYGSWIDYCRMRTKGEVAPGGETYPAPGDGRSGG